MNRDPTELFPPSEFVYVPNVPVFKTHSRLKGGKQVTVTEKDLGEIADRHNESFDSLGIAVPLTLGHTREEADGTDVAETEQPPIVGWSVRYKTGSLENGEPALYCDWYVRKEHKDVIRSYPTRSVEYYVNRKSFWPIALLKSSAPELELPIIRYATGRDEPHLTFTLTSPISYETETMPDFDKKDDEKKMADKPADKKSPDEKAMDDAQDGAKKGAVSDKSDMAEIKQMLAQINGYLPLLAKLQEIMDAEEGGEGEGEDLMAKPDDKDMDKPAPTDKPMPAEKDAAKNFEKPVEFSAMGSSTNTSIPSFGKDKENYKVNKNDEQALKYKAQLDAVKAELEATQKITKDLYTKNRKAEAEKMVAEIETVCKYRSDKARQQDLDMLAKLDEKVALEYVAMAKDRYERKLPDSKSVEEVAKYAVDREPDLTAKTPEEAHERAMAILKSGLSREEYYKQLAQGKGK